MQLYFGYEFITGFNLGIEFVDPQKINREDTEWIILIDLGIIRFVVEKEGV